MNMEEYRERRQQEKRRRTLHNIIVIMIGILLVAALVTGGIILGRHRKGAGDRGHRSDRSPYTGGKPGLAVRL